MRSLVLLFLVLLASCAHAIVIIPPTVYIVTISLASFIGNAIILIVGWIAVSGIAAKKFFGKSVSEIMAFTFSGIKKLVVAVVSMLAALLLFNPIEIFSILTASLAAAIITLALLALGSYSKYRLVGKTEKTRLLRSTVFFAAIVFVLSALAISVSLEITQVNASPEGLFAKQAVQETDFRIGLPDASKEMASAPAASAPMDTAGEDAEKKVGGADRIWFYPAGAKPCIVIVGSKVFEFAPTNNCYFLENSAPQRMVCPVSISIAEVSARGSVNVSATGSCSYEGTIIVSETGFLVE